MTEEPNFVATAASWIVNAAFAVALLIGRMTYQRGLKRQDDIELRLRELERDSVTHADLQRIEDKFDKLVDRLDRLLERNQCG